MVLAPYWPFIVLAAGITLVVLLIVVLRLHAFIALMLSAIAIGLLSGNLPGDQEISHFIRSVEIPMQEFGGVAGQIAFVIALAAIIGTAMMQSGAAERIVNALVSAFGEQRAAIALIASSLVLAIPVFFDTVFFLLIPLAQALRQKTGKDYALFIMAIAGGAAITHHLVPPTPGPLIMAETLELDLGLTIMAGLAAALIPALVVYYGGTIINKRTTIPFRTDGTVPATSSQDSGWQPGLFISLVPVFLPVFLISLATIVNLVAPESPANTALGFAGNKNIAMLLGMLVALQLWAKKMGWKLRDLGDAVSEPLQVAGTIILITCAGGAFGAMIRLAGIADAVAWATQDIDTNYIFLAWVIAAVMKVAQGSGTVSMITTSSIMAAILGTGVELPYHPMYVLLAIGFGSMVGSWMNDSGFWVVAKMGRLTEQETLQTWSLLLALIGVFGLIQLLLFSSLMPFL